MKKIIKLLCLTLILTLLTGCAASEEIIVEPTEVHPLIDLNEVPIPEYGLSFTATPQFPINDLETITNLFLPGQSYETSEWIDGLLLKTDAASVKLHMGIDLFKDGVGLQGEVQDTLGLVYTVVPSKYDYRMHYATLDKYGKVEQNLVEHPDDDSMMAQYQAHAEKILQELNYPAYELAFSGFYSTETQKKIALFDASCDPNAAYTEHYYFWFHTSPDDTNGRAANMQFVYDETGLCYAELDGLPVTVRQEKTEAISVTDAYDTAVKALEPGEYWLMGAEFDYEYIVSKTAYTERSYGSEWIFTFCSYHEFTEKERQSVEYNNQYKVQYEQLGDAVKQGAYLTVHTVRVSPNGIVDLNRLDYLSDMVFISQYTDPTGIWWPLEERGAE